MSFYLEKIHQTYYFRLRVPKDMFPYLGVRQLRKSLKTSNHADAKTLSKGFLFATEKLFVAIRSNMLTQEQIFDLITAYKANYLSSLTTARREKGKNIYLPADIKIQMQKGEISLSSQEVPHHRND